MKAKDLLNYESKNVASLFRILLDNACILKDDDVQVSAGLKVCEIRILIRHSITSYDLKRLNVSYVNYFSFSVPLGQIGFYLTIHVDL